jgi:hypothetical protein
MAFTNLIYAPLLYEIYNNSFRYYSYFNNLIKNLINLIYLINYVINTKPT